MSTPHDPWLDEQLQAVPLPAGLLARLRGIATGSDAGLDAALREVPVGGEMLAGLRSIPQDVALDEQLRDVPVPHGLAARLLPEELQPAGQMAVVEQGPESLPVELLSRDRNFSWTRFSVWTAAACLALTTAGVVFFATQPDFVPPGDPLVVVGPHDVHGLEAPLLEVDRPLEHVSLLADTKDSDTAPPIALASEWPASIRLGPAADILGMPREQLVQSLWMLRWSGELLTVQPLRENVRDLERAAELTPRGLSLPVVPGYDRVFQLKYGVHPIVSPAAHASLQVSGVPLVTQTGSYDYLRQLLRRGELPAPDRIRVEEFIAATGVGGSLPAPGQIDLRIAAGLSPFGALRTFGSEGMQRLPPGRPHLVAVQTAAGSVAKRVHPATHLVIALDGSESMRWGNRFEHARRGIGGLVEMLGPRDLMTIVRMGVRAEVIVDRASRSDLSNLEFTLAQTPPRGPIDLGEGLRVAGDLAVQSASERGRERLTKQLVVVTDGIDGLPPEREARFSALLAALGEQQVGVLLLDVGGPSAPRGTLARLAEQGEARVMAADSGNEVQAALVESLTGGSSVLGEEAALTVKFNPKAVAGYRLLGHEGSLAGGLIPAGLESTILAGDRTTVLYEVWLANTAESEILEATLVWQEGSAGKVRRRQASLSASQVVHQWDALPGDVQAAAIAAEAADVLRGSYFAVGRNRDLRPVLAVADRVSSTLATEPSFKEFIGVLRAAEQVRMTRRAP